VEYWAVCRGLPVGAHRNGSSGKNDGTWKEIPQYETSPNVWGPSPAGEYDLAGSDSNCFFACDGVLLRDELSRTCKLPRICDIDKTCKDDDITITDGTTSFTIMACNLGSPIAGTGIESYGCYFQRGNNFGFVNT
jgi:hypothetical protein